MSEKIEVGYRNLGIIGGVEYYHKFLLYTDKNNNQYTISGWAGDDISVALPSGHMSVAVNMAYDKYNPDFPSADQKQYRELITIGDDLNTVWSNMAQNAATKDDIYPYDPLRQNSNTMADSILRSVGLREPTLDNLDTYSNYEYWAPASGNILRKELVPIDLENNIIKGLGAKAIDQLSYLDSLNPENQQIVAAMWNETTSGTTIGLDDDSTIYLVSNSLDGLGNVISGTRLSPNGVAETTNSYFTGVDGTLLGNIKGYDPSISLYDPANPNAEVDYTKYMDPLSRASIAEAFQQTMANGAFLSSGVATSAYAYADSLFNGYLAYDDSNSFSSEAGQLGSDGNWYVTTTNGTVINMGSGSSSSGYTGMTVDGMLEQYNNGRDGFSFSIDSNGNGQYGGSISFNTWNDVDDFIHDIFVHNDNGWSVGTIVHEIVDFWNKLFPVALDLDGDGVELTSVIDSKAWYDVAGDGSLHQTGWVGKDDALLAYDENGDGKITTQHELAFASRTTAVDTDLEAIRTEFDTNHDGVLDANDTNFGKFRVWQDLDSDGEVTHLEKYLADGTIPPLCIESNTPHSQINSQMYTRISKEYNKFN